MGEAERIVRRFAELYSDGTSEDYGSERFLELYAPDIDWVEFPTPIHPAGESGDREAVRKAVAQNAGFLRDRKIEIDEIVEQGAVAAWTGTFSASVGVDGLDAPKGSRIKIRMATVTEVRDGQIVRQHEYLAFPEVG